MVAFKMKELTIEKFIKEQNYKKQQVIYSIFFFVALAIFLIELMLVKDLSFNSIFSLVIVTVFVLIPFGFFLGLRKMVAVTKKIKKIKNLEIIIEEKKVIDKTRVHADSSNRYCQIVFNENEGVWVSRATDKKIKVGDICYLFYLKNANTPCAIYGKKYTSLCKEFEENIIK